MFRIGELNIVSTEHYSDDGSLEEGACLGMKNIGKPCTGKPYARFDEGGLVKLSMKWLLRHRQTKGTETDRPFLQMSKPVLYSTFILI